MEQNSASYSKVRGRGDRDNLRYRILREVTLHLGLVTRFLNKPIKFGWYCMNGE